MVHYLVPPATPSRSRPARPSFSHDIPAPKTICHQFDTFALQASCFLHPAYALAPYFSQRVSINVCFFFFRAHFLLLFVSKAGVRGVSKNAALEGAVGWAQILYEGRTKTTHSGPSLSPFPIHDCLHCLLTFQSEDKLAIRRCSIYIHSILPRNLNARKP